MTGECQICFDQHELVLVSHGCAHNVKYCRTCVGRHIEAEVMACAESQIALALRAFTLTCTRTYPRAYVYSILHSCTHARAHTHAHARIHINATLLLHSQVNQKGNTIEITCPNSDCDAKVEHGDVHRLATASVFDYYDQQLLRRALRAMPDFQWCKSSQCGAGQVTTCCDIHRRV